MKLSEELQILYDGGHDIACYAIGEIIDKLQELEAMTQWQSIKTAPKDGTHFDAWSLEGFRYAKCRYIESDDGVQLCWWRDTFLNQKGEWLTLNESMFKHWTDIPKPPQAD